MTIHHGLFGLWPMRGEGKCGERERDVRWRDGGLGEVKGQRKKGGTFSEDGRLEKKQRGTITPMFKRLFSAPPHLPSDTSQGQHFKVREFVALSPQAHLEKLFFFSPKREIIFLSFSLFSIFIFIFFVSSINLYSCSLNLIKHVLPAGVFAHKKTQTNRKTCKKKKKKKSAKT